MESHDMLNAQDTAQDPLPTIELCAQTLTEEQTQYIPVLKRIPEDTEEQEPVKNKKARLGSLNLSRKQETSLVKWFKEHEIFYNKKLTIYKDVDERNRLLTEKANELNCYTGQLRSWLDGMRTRYGRLSAAHTEEDLDDMTERERWIFENFNFLRPHIVRCPTRQVKRHQEPILDIRHMTSVHKASTSTTPAVIVKALMDEEEDNFSQASDEASQPSTTFHVDTSAIRKIKSPLTNSNNSLNIPNEDLLNKLQDQYKTSITLQSQIASLLQPVNDNEANVVNYTNYLASLCRQMSPQVFRTFQRHTTTYAIDLLENRQPVPPAAPPGQTAAQTQKESHIQQLQQVMCQLLQHYQQILPQH